jgi:predicted nucleotidyltransferase
LWYTIQDAMDAGKRLPQIEYGPLLNDVVPLLKKQFGKNLLAAVLYGSVASGAARRDSDIDVCLIFRELPQSMYERTRYVLPVKEKLRQQESYRKLYGQGYYPELSLLEFTADEIEDTPEVFLDMVDARTILLDDGTFRRKMGKLRRRMKELGTHKIVREDGSYYWVLKSGATLGEEITL